MSEFMGNVTKLIQSLSETEHGFKHIVDAGDMLLTDPETGPLKLAKELLKHSTYQARMLGTHLLGALAAENTEAMRLLKETVSKDENWRVQEMLAKAFDRFCKDNGYKESLPVIQEWLASTEANVVRAVCEGLRIWTSRPYFKQHPSEAIALLAVHRDHSSEYVRKSVGNALRDIRRKHEELVTSEIETWDQTDKRVLFTYKLVTK